MLQTEQDAITNQTKVANSTLASPRWWDPCKIEPRIGPKPRRPTVKIMLNRMPLVRRRRWIVSYQDATNKSNSMDNNVATLSVSHTNHVKKTTFKRAIAGQSNGLRKRESSSYFSANELEANEMGEKFTREGKTIFSESASEEGESGMANKMKKLRGLESIVYFHYHGVVFGIEDLLKLIVELEKSYYGIYMLQTNDTQQQLSVRQLSGLLDGIKNWTLPISYTLDSNAKTFPTISSISDFSRWEVVHSTRKLNSMLQYFSVAFEQSQLDLNEVDAENREISELIGKKNLQAKDRLKQMSSVRKLMEQSIDKLMAVLCSTSKMHEHLLELIQIKLSFFTAKAAKSSWLIERSRAQMLQKGQIDDNHYHERGETNKAFVAKSSKLDKVSRSTMGHKLRFMETSSERYLRDLKLVSLFRVSLRQFQKSIKAND